MLKSIHHRLNKLMGWLSGDYYLTKVRRFEGFESSDPIIGNELRELINNYSCEFVFTEFGKNRVNAGGAQLSQEDRLEPSLSGIKKYFPNAKITVFTDFDWERDDINVIKVVSPLKDITHPRFGYRTAVYFKFKGLINSKADFCCALDTDMQFVSERVYALVKLTKKFGCCVAANEREILSFDMRVSFDTQPVLDDSLAAGRSYNQSPMTLWKGDKRGENYFEACMNIMLEDPSRGSLVMWKAAWQTGIHPYVLPKQFCVCNGDVGCGDEIILHIGHPRVSAYYNFSLDTVPSKPLNRPR